MVLNHHIATKKDVRTPKISLARLDAFRLRDLRGSNAPKFNIQAHFPPTTNMTSYNKEVQLILAVEAAK
ncbi:hypothetical protein BGZ61DRAFT_368380 [Ilyonectria robusta]|uniref:uncharacterized protein n=1 Tax=Ilyonectria robusta TaxID=1079257 RepID=UPI001E8DF39F|nr:uncharacterized protein BGZ61DRAFT_368380 [Ilyonectria robusta]KAH8662804.1 hypothetical protein BGZ61DRAFT_368380 [Ilyonectria robusta]